MGIPRLKLIHGMLPQRINACTRTEMQNILRPRKPSDQQSPGEIIAVLTSRLESFPLKIVAAVIYLPNLGSHATSRFLRSNNLPPIRHLIAKGDRWHTKSQDRSRGGSYNLLSLGN